MQDTQATIKVGQQTLGLNIERSLTATRERTISYIFAGLIEEELAPFIQARRQGTAESVEVMRQKLDKLQTLCLALLETPAS